MREGEMLEALMCGFLVALIGVILFKYLEYMGFGGMGTFLIFPIGLLIINFTILLLIAWPFRFNGMVVFLITTLVIGYFLFGPYSEMIVPHIEKIREDIPNFQNMIQKQVHCTIVLLTNPLNYEKECGHTQSVAEKEKPINYGVELTSFNIFPKKFIPGDVAEIAITLKNKGDYDANVSITTDKGQYRGCNLSILKNLTQENGTFYIPKETGVDFSPSGIIVDPWEENCTYVKNKAKTGGTINFEIKYKYVTESYLEDMTIVRERKDYKKSLEITSAKEKRTPATILMSTTKPLVFKGNEQLKSRMIRIGIANRRNKGTIIFRGKYTYKDVLTEITNSQKICNLLCASNPRCISECMATLSVQNSNYDHCVNSTDESQIIEKCEITENGNKTEVDITDEPSCRRCGGKPKYKIFAKMAKKNYDKIIIRPIGEVNDMIRLSCHGKQSEVTPKAACTCLNNICEIIYTGEKGDLKIRPQNEEFLYTGLKIEVVDFPEDIPGNIRTFSLFANSTYLVDLVVNKQVSVNSPYE